MRAFLAIAAAAAAAFMGVAEPSQAMTADRPAYDKATVRSIVEDEARRSSVPLPLALAVAHVESRFQAHAVSSKGARGVMQIMPATARGSLGIHPDDLWEPRTNVRAGLAYLTKLRNRYGSWELALSHYNGGTLRKAAGVYRPHGYTAGYVADVLAARDRFAAETGAGFHLAQFGADGAMPPLVIWEEPGRAGAVAPRRQAGTGRNGSDEMAWLRETAPGAGRRLDDFGPGGAVARHAGRGVLDDFTPRVRWQPGS